jgi:hypothetical protein
LYAFAVGPSGRSTTHVACLLPILLLTCSRWWPSSPRWPQTSPCQI